ncbi:MAG: zf-HC2 domain-containing protein [Deltaproteobacteria bacterium]|nr:zf-HC2 domain-containing protein [Deltaproteobacteria bacterium]
MTARVIDLGGPGAGCSASKVRRLRAGELAGAEKDALEAHVRGCARCQATEREITKEADQLAQVLPFDAFAAGVAEKLADAPAQSPSGPETASAPPSITAGAKGSRAVVSLTARRRWQTWALPLAVAASLAIVFSSAKITRAIAERVRESQGIPVEPRDDARTRWKGGDEPIPDLFALRQGRSFKLTGDERVHDGDRLMLVLAAPPRPFVTVALREAGEVSLLFRGRARLGPLPEAFEWTGANPQGELIVLYSDRDLAADAVLARLRSGAALVNGPDETIVVREVLRR